MPKTSGPFKQPTEVNRNQLQIFQGTLEQVPFDEPIEHLTPMNKHTYVPTLADINFAKANSIPVKLLAKTLSEIEKTVKFDHPCSLIDLRQRY